MPSISQYISSVKRIDGIVRNRTQGLTQEDSMRQLPFPGNCMNWNLGHLLVYRMQILGVIDGSTQADPAEFAIYGAGSPPLTDETHAIPLPVLLGRLDDASARIVAGLEGMPESRLDEIYDAERGITVDDRLAFYLIFHESYHAGQLEILQELAQAHRQSASA